MNLRGLILIANADQYRVKTTAFPSTGERFVIVEGPPHGIALDATSLYTSMCLREAGLSPNSMAQHLSAIILLLEWGDNERRGIDIDERLQTVSLFSAEEILSIRRYLRQNRNLGRLRDPNKREMARSTVRHGHYYFRCHAVCSYVIWHAQRSIGRIPSRDVESLQEARIRLDTFRKQIIGDLPSPRKRQREGVDETVQRSFLAAIRPGSPSNPFKAPYQVRNYVLLLLYHELGLRKADALKIKGEDLQLHGLYPTVNIIIRHDEPGDPRTKEPRHKTFGRTLPLGKELVSALKEWILEERPRLPNARRSPYVFLSRSGAPLSLATVNDMFDLLRKRVPPLTSFTAHITRHNANDRLSEVAKELGWNEAEEQRNRSGLIVTAGLFGPRILGALRVAQSLLSVLNVAREALENIVPPLAAKALAKSGLPALRHVLGQALLVAALISIAAVSGLRVSGPLLLHWLYGGEILEFSWVIIWSSLGFPTALVTVVLNCAFRTLEQTRSIFLAVLAGACFSLVAVYPAALIFGVAGLIAVALLSQLIVLVVLVVLVARISGL